MKTSNEILFEHGINTMFLNDEFNSQLLHAMERYAEEKIRDSAGWIKIEDRLPEAGQMIDTWNGIANRRCKFEKPDLFIRHVEPFSNERIYITHFPDVTHWRLLPTPPNEKAKSWTDKQDTLDKAKSASLKPNKLSESEIEKMAEEYSTKVWDLPNGEKWNQKLIGSKKESFIAGSKAIIELNKK